MITLQNDFHGTSTKIDETRPFTRRRIAAIKRRLCSPPECVCAGFLGHRGRQNIPDDVMERLYQAVRAAETE